MNDPTITPRHHALLFAYLAREVLEELGQEQGAGLLERAVWRYGLERGRRMAIRALADGHELTFRTYLAYGEWRHVDESAAGPSEVETLRSSPDLVRRVLTCPWHRAWTEADLLAYGQHYCRHIDRALVEGFNPALTLRVDDTLSAGGPYCSFTYVEAHLSSDDLMAIDRERRALASRVIMPWSYHLGHLYKTMGEVIAEAKGPMGELLVSDGFQSFADRFPTVAQLAASRLGTDFTLVPGG
jgi:hypothetical protein